MIFLTGAINIQTRQQLEEEAARYAAEGWEYTKPTTHKVRVTIDERDIDALCAWLKARPRDKQPKAWTDRHGNRHESRTVSFHLNGTEETGTWIPLRSRIDNQATPPAGAPATSGRSPAPAPRRPAAPPPPSRPLPQRLASPPAAERLEQHSPSPATPWSPPVYGPSNGLEDADVPF